MKRPKSTRLPEIKDFLIRKLFSSGDAAAWDLIRTWQRERLISVQAVTKQSAWVEITEAGKERCK